MTLLHHLFWISIACPFSEFKRWSLVIFFVRIHLFKKYHLWLLKMQVHWSFPMNYPNTSVEVVLWILATNKSCYLWIMANFFIPFLCRGHKTFIGNDIFNNLLLKSFGHFPINTAVSSTHSFKLHWYFVYFNLKFLIPLWQSKGRLKY